MILMVSRLDCRTWDATLDFVAILKARGYSESTPDRVAMRLPRVYTVTEHGRGARVSYTEPKIELIAARSHRAAFGGR